MKLHADEIEADETVVRGLLAAQCPQWAGLPLARAGAGTDNAMYRLGDGLLVRLPRKPDGEDAVRKELAWLPRLGPSLSWRVPEPVFAGTATDAFPLPWSVYRWIDGAEPGRDTVRDWAVFGSDLASFVRELHGVDLMGARRAGALSWYRGGDQGSCDGWVTTAFEDCRKLVRGEGGGGPGNGDAASGDPLDVDALERMWRSALTLPEPAGVQPHVWLHGDLKPTNLLVRKGALHAVIDFGALSVGRPDAEHAPVWDLPAAARRAYWEAAGLDDATWARARAWAIAVGVAGIAYYWHTFPAFVAECRNRLDAILTDAGGGGGIATPGLSM